MTHLKTLLFFITLILGSIIAAPNAHAVVTTDCCTYNVLENESFEEVKNGKLTDWIFVPETNTIRVDGKIPTSTWDRAQGYQECGSYYGLMHYKGYFYQDTDILPGYKATLKIYGGYHNGSDNQKFHLIFLNSSKNVVGTSVVVPLTKNVQQGDGLTQYTLTADAPTGAAFVRVQGSSDFDYFKVDKACLTITPPPAVCNSCTANKLINPSFELTKVVKVGNSNVTVPQTWIGSTNFTSDAGYVVCDSKNGLINGGAGYFYQDVTVKETQQVSLKIWGGYHVQDGHQFQLLFYAKATDANPISKVFVELDKSVEQLNNKLKPYTLTATAPKGATVVRVKGVSSGNYFKVDFACLTITGDGPLPVTLSEFKVEKELKSANLSWTTVSESNSREFEVQHSGDGKQWNSVGNVNAKGESATTVYYNYVHNNPLAGNNLYRLKMIDADNTFALSRIVNVSFESEMTIFPNPTSETLKLNATTDRILNVKLYSLNGVLVLDAAPDSSNEISLAKLMPGNYIVKINQLSGAVTSRKIQIVR